jgi:tRNA(Ile)-lysidine synthase
VGHSGAEKIKSLFQEARVPLWERRHWPIVIMGEEILWARRFGPAAGYAADSGSSPILGIRETES